jgi:hypothetical protein
LKIHFNIILPYAWFSRSGLLSSGPPTKILQHLFFRRMCYMPHPFQFSLFNHPNNYNSDTLSITNLVQCSYYLKYCSLKVNIFRLQHI